MGGKITISVYAPSAGTGQQRAAPGLSAGRQRFRRIFPNQERVVPLTSAGKTDMMKGVKFCMESVKDIE